MSGNVGIQIKNNQRVRSSTIVMTFTISWRGTRTGRTLLVEMACWGMKNSMAGVQIRCSY